MAARKLYTYGVSASSDLTIRMYLLHECHILLYTVYIYIYMRTTVVCMHSCTHVWCESPLQRARQLEEHETLSRQNTVYVMIFQRKTPIAKLPPLPLLSHAWPAPPRVPRTSRLLRWSDWPGVYTSAPCLGPGSPSTTRFSRTCSRRTDQSMHRSQGAVWPILSLAKRVFHCPVLGRHGFSEPTEQFDHAQGMPLLFDESLTAAIKHSVLLLLANK